MMAQSYVSRLYPNTSFSPVINGLQEGDSSTVNHRRYRECSKWVLVTPTAIMENHMEKKKTDNEIDTEVIYGCIVGASKDLQKPPHSKEGPHDDQMTHKVHIFRAEVPK